MHFIHVFNDKMYNYDKMLYKDYEECRDESINSYVVRNRKKVLLFLSVYKAKVSLRRFVFSFVSKGYMYDTCTSM